MSCCFSKPSKPLSLSEQESIKEKMRIALEKQKADKQRAKEQRIASEKQRQANMKLAMKKYKKQQREEVLNNRCLLSGRTLQCT